MGEMENLKRIFRVGEVVYDEPSSMAGMVRS